MYKKVLVAVLMLALLAGGVGLGIHLLHKEALAQVSYVVEIWDVDEDEWLTMADVSMSFDGGAEWEDAFEFDPGRYRVIRDDHEASGHIYLDPGLGYTGSDPAGNPVEGQASVAFLFWEVEVGP